MKTNTIAPDYKGYRFPSGVISYAVWLYFRFSLSYRDVEELLAQCGIVVTYETVRQWCLKFGSIVNLFISPDEFSPLSSTLYIFQWHKEQAL